MSDDKRSYLSIYTFILKMIVFCLLLIASIPLLMQIDWSTAETVAVESTPISETKMVQILDGKDVETGFVVDEGWEVVKTNCTQCHNSKIILQNRFTKDKWKELIVWMQETQGLWKLGGNEEIILNYLAKHYAPMKKGRRPRLKIEEEDWYILE